MSNRIREKFLLSRAELDAVANGPGQDGSDLLIRNNGDGSDFKEVHAECDELANRIDRDLVRETEKS